MTGFYSLSALAALALFGAAPVIAADSVSPLPRIAVDLESLDGEVGAIKDDSFDVMVGDVRHTVRTDENTKYLLNSEDSTRAKVLVKGQKVSVSLERGLATKVDAEGSAATELKGKIKSVGEESFVLLVDGKERTVEIGSDTTYSLDGKEARKGQVLVADKEVSVELSDGVATKVSARSKA